MGHEPDQVGSSGEGPIRKEDVSGQRTGGKQFGNKKLLSNNPGNIRSAFTERSSDLSGYMFDTKKSKQVQAKSYIKTVKEIKYT